MTVVEGFAELRLEAVRTIDPNAKTFLTAAGLLATAAFSGAAETAPASGDVNVKVSHKETTLPTVLSS